MSWSTHAHRPSFDRDNWSFDRDNWSNDCTWQHPAKGPAAAWGQAGSHQGQAGLQLDSRAPEPVAKVHQDQKKIFCKLVACRGSPLHAWHAKKWLVWPHRLQRLCWQEALLLGEDQLSRLLCRQPATGGPSHCADRTLFQDSTGEQRLLAAWSIWSYQRLLTLQVVSRFWMS